MKETFGNSGGEVGVFFFTKMEIPERWGVLAEIPSMVGVWIFSGTTHFKPNYLENLHGYPQFSFQWISPW